MNNAAMTRTDGSRARRLAWVVVATSMALTLLPAPHALAAPGVTLKASATKLIFGQTTRLFGRIEPAAQGETVSIIDGAAQVLATDKTDADGRYSVRIEPRQNVTVRARWIAALSTPIQLKVKPVIVVKLRKPLLFGRARIRGRVNPVHPGERVQVSLVRGRRSIATKNVRLRSGHWFSTSFAVRKPGTYKAKILFDDADHVASVVYSAGKTTSLPYLGVGSRGRMVRLLEKRLGDLQYHLTGKNDGYFDYRTSDAMIAFNKIKGRARVGSVSTSTWTALANARVPQPRHRRGTHIEIDQTRQILMTVRNGKVTNVVHTSTGASGTATYDGTHYIHRKVGGYSPGRLYYPSYFDGLRAIHGWPEVPTYPASHGCARVPMWAAQHLYRIATMGMKVYVYH